MGPGEAVLAPELPAQQTSLLRRGLVRWAVLFGLWTIPGILSASQGYLLYGQKEGLSFLDILARQLPPWLYWALVTPAILYLARRFPVERNHWPRSVAVHLIGMVVLGFGHVMTTIAVGFATSNPWTVNNPFDAVLRMSAMKNLIGNVITYAGVLAVAHALEYYRRFREGAIASARLSTQLAQAQLAALKMQLHPHFLFNTLHAIAVLVRKQDTQGSVRMITGLSDLLRLVLDSDGQQLVPLKQELDFISRYLDIERVRFADRLRVTSDVAHDTLDAQVPYLVLQPLVENAIRHGIASRASAGELEIVARRRGGELVVTIRDDGAGVRPGSPPGLGLRNVRARLEQLHPGRHRLTLADDPRGGAIATLEMPFIHG